MKIEDGIYEVGESDGGFCIYNKQNDDEFVVCSEETANRIAERLTEFQTLFNLQWTRMKEAVKYWQEETGNEYYPDLGALLKWLIEEAKKKS